MEPGFVIALAFSAGMVATVNPCGFALLPAYLSYFLGLDAAGGTGSGTAGGRSSPTTDTVALRSTPVMRALAVSGAVSAGFMTVFGIMGFVWGSISSIVAARLPYFTLVIGLLLVVLGIAMLRGFEPVLRLPKLDVGRSSRELGSMYLYGVSYAVASLSCTIPIFVGIVSTTLDRDSFALGVATFVAFGAGMAATLSLLTLAVALARTGLVHRFRRLLPHINKISGGFLILAGTFVAYYAWVSIQELNRGQSSRLVEWSRDVQESMINWVESVGAGKLALAAAIIIGAAVAITIVTRMDGSRPPALDGSAPDVDESTSRATPNDVSGRNDPK